jgi:hypothetical protein
MVTVNYWKRLSLLIVIVLAMMALVALSLNGLTSANASSVELNLLGADTEVPDEGSGNEPATKIKLGADSAVAFNRSADGSNELAVGETGTYIVVLKDESLARYNGGIVGLAPTSRQATGATQLDARSPESVNYLSYLAGQRAVAIKTASNSIGRGLDVSYEYGATIVGFAAEMTAEEAGRVAALDQVAFVELEKISFPQTDAGPVWAGASAVWGGTWNALSYKATLSGANEVPPVTSTVTGLGEFTYNFYTNALSYTIPVENPNNVNLSDMHIHSGTMGTNGDVIHNFGIAATTNSFTETGSVILTDDQEAALVNKKLYINVHSLDNAGGEVRGQIELNGSLGEGVVVGVIDTGIDPWNPSFLATGGDGYIHNNPLGTGNYLGVCDSTNAGDDEIVGYDATFPCNDKLIGVWGYKSVSATPRDSEGHGSHTAGTAAGNVVFDAVVNAPTEVFTSDISGVAPHANIIAYGACCTGSALNASRDQALLDGVDVINYSIGSSAPTGDLCCNFKW